MTQDKQDSPRSAKASGRQIGLGRKLLLAGCTLALALFLAEVGLRVRAWARYGSSNSGSVDQMIQLDPTLGFAIPTPGYERHGDLISITVNSLGFRGDEFSLEKQPGTVRIACIGGSTTFCGEVSGDHKTWPHQLQDRLREKYGENIEVINAGIPGYTVSASQRNLEKRVLQLKPDVLLVYHAINDMAKDTKRLAVEAGIVTESSGQQPWIIQIASEYSLLVDLVYKNLRIQAGGGNEKLESLPPDLAGRFIQHFREIHEITNRHGIQLVLSTFLTKYRPDQTPEEQKANADVAFYYMPWMTMELLRDGMDRYNQAIMDFADEAGIPVIRERDSIPADKEHFVDCMHLADAGCALMADRFATFLISQSIVDPEPSAKASSP